MKTMHRRDAEGAEEGSKGWNFFAALFQSLELRLCVLGASAVNSYA